MTKRIDRDALYDYLWSLADRAGRLRINQQHLADDLGIDRVTIATIFADFQKSGKLIKIKGGYRRVVMYRVVNPKEWSCSKDLPTEHAE